MLHRFLSLTARNMRLITRNYYLAIIVILALFYAATTHFLVPAEVGREPAVVLWDATSGQAMRQLYERTATSQAIFVDSEEGYAQQLEAAGRIGLKVTGAVIPEKVEITYQGWETERTRRLLETSIQGQVAAISGGVGTTFPVFERVTLREGQAGERPPFNLSLVPIFVFSEAVMMGIFLAGALLIADKEERTNLAYQVSPAGTVEYMLASCTAMGLLGLVFTVVLNLLTTGLAGNWPVILLLVFAGAVVTTVIVLAYGVFFRNLSQFLPGALVVMFVLSVPAASYFMPSFSPLVVRLLPSYALIFALHEAYFPAGNPGMTMAALQQLGITFLVLSPLVIWSLRRQLRGGEA